MIKQTFKQIWNQRKLNSWLLAELIIVFVLAGWLAMTSIFPALYQRYCISSGFKEEGIHLITLQNLDETAYEYDSARAHFHTLHEDILQFAQTLKGLHEIEAVSVHTCHFPYSGANYNISINHDSVQTYVLFTPYLRGWDMQEVFQFENSTNEKWGKSNYATSDAITVSESVMEQLSAQKSAQQNSEKTTFTFYGDATPYTIERVVNNVKNNPYLQPENILMVPMDQLYEEYVMNGEIVISIRASDAFIKEFKENTMSTLKFGNVRAANVMTLEEATYNWFYDEIKMLFLAVFFGLLIVFLGVVGSFWLKIEARKGEIGVRMALGASARKVVTQFVSEGVLLLTISSIVGGILLVNIAYFTGVYTSNDTVPEAWPVNNTVALVSFSILLTYMVMAIVVILGSALPMIKGVKVNPATALKDE